MGRRHAYQSRLLTWILYSLLAWHGSCISCGCGGEIEKEVLEYQRRSFGFSFGMTEVAAGAWVGAVLGSLAVGLTGLAPLLFIPTQAAISTSQVGFSIYSRRIIPGQGSRKLRLLLSFAVGGLLGDVFLHLFPESLAALGDHGRSHTGLLVMGLWILGGILTFLILEKVFEFTEEDEEKNNNKLEVGKKRILGYLNLAANCIDNFIHGLAVASSFLSSFKLGLITTFAILVHEIPHEIGDFAILLR